MEPYVRGPAEVAVSIVRDPVGRPMILLQLPNGWITMRPQDARLLSKTLLDSVDDYEKQFGEGPPLDRRFTHGND